MISGEFCDFVLNLLRGLVHILCRLKTMEGPNRVPEYTGRIRMDGEILHGIRGIFLIMEAEGL